jgi:hypothetical protein
MTFTLGLDCHVPVAVAEGRVRSIRNISARSCRATPRKWKPAGGASSPRPPARFGTRIADIYAKKNGALEFVVCGTHVSNVAGEPVAELRSTIIVRKL